MTNEIQKEIQKQRRKNKREMLKAPLNSDDINLFPGFYLEYNSEIGECQFDIDLGLDFWLKKHLKILGQPRTLCEEDLSQALPPDSPVVLERITGDKVVVWSFDQNGQLFDVGKKLGFKARGRHKALESHETEESIKSKLYQYPAHVVYSYDADTTTADIDLGFDCSVRQQKIRYYGINAPELRGSEREQGLISKEALLELMPDDSDVVFQAVPDNDFSLNVKRSSKGKFGRWLGILWVRKGDEKVNVNQYLLDNGFAREYLI